MWAQVPAGDPVVIDMTGDHGHPGLSGRVGQVGS